MYQAIIEYPTPKCLVEELDRVAEQIQELQQYQTRLQLSSNFTAAILEQAPAILEQAPAILEQAPAILEQAPARHTAIWQHFDNSIILRIFIKEP